MYDYGYSYGYGLIGGNTYNPLINYNWSTTTTSGLRYLKDVGSTLTYNASMYFGRGAYFNGVDQSITVPINTTIQTSLKRVNGVVTINETSQTLTNYVISGLGVHKDYYLFTRLLTTAEKDSYTNTPEAFYAMAQADNTCVLNMPMCETDGYVRNMKSYSKGVERTQNVNITTAEYLVNSGETTVANNALRIYSSAGAWSSAINNNVLLPNTEAYYLIEFNVSIITIQGNLQFSQNGTNNNAAITPVLGKNLVVLKASSVIYDDLVIGRASGAVDVTISSISVKQLSGVYQITNYTSSVRDNAKNLQYGLQTCKFVRDSLGVIQSASDYLECDGVGYADTGWIPNVVGSWSVEIILKVTTKNDVGLYSYKGIGIHNLCSIKMFNYLNGSLNISIGLDHFNNYGCFSILQEHFVHIVVVNNSNIFTVYLNKVLIGTTTKVNKASTQNKFFIGSVSGYVNTQALNEPMRQFKLHNKELTQEEITANYNSYVAKGLLS